jgi:hypothetical protein
MGVNVRQEPTVALVVISHRTDGLLERCLASLSACRDVDRWSLVIVRQLPDGAPDPCSGAIRGLRWAAEAHIQAGELPIERLIDRNRALAYDLAFRSLDADACLVVEDDVLLAPDALAFCRSMLERYTESRLFRGVNLGSHETGPKATPEGYSLLRFGLHGQAAMLPARTWRHLSDAGLLDWRKQGHWDARIEDHMKSGFVATPNRSRYLDLGTRGVHRNSRSDGVYFAKLQESWVGDEPVMPDLYRHEQIQHAWRRDARSYRKWEFVRYQPALLKWFRILRRTLHGGAPGSQGFGR